MVSIALQDCIDDRYHGHIWRHAGRHSIHLSLIVRNCPSPNDGSRQTTDQNPMQKHYEDISMNSAEEKSASPENFAEEKSASPRNLHWLKYAGLVKFPLIITSGRL